MRRKKKYWVCGGKTGKTGLGREDMGRDKNKKQMEPSGVGMMCPERAGTEEVAVKGWSWNSDSRKRVKDTESHQKGVKSLRGTGRDLWDDGNAWMLGSEVVPFLFSKKTKMGAALPGTAIPRFSWKNWSSITWDSHSQFFFFFFFTEKWEQHCLEQPFPDFGRKIGEVLPGTAIPRFFGKKTGSSTAWDSHSQLFLTEKWQQHCLGHSFQFFWQKKNGAALPGTLIPVFLAEKMGAAQPGTAVPKSDWIIQCRQVFPSERSHLFNFSLIPCWSWLQDVWAPLNHPSSTSALSLHITTPISLYRG